MKTNSLILMLVAALILSCADSTSFPSLDEVSSSSLDTGISSSSGDGSGSSSSLNLQLSSSSLDNVNSSSSSSSLNVQLSSSSFDNVNGSSSSNGFEAQFKDGVFTDLRDNKKYKYEAASSGQIWMSDNLNFSNNNTIGFCYGVDVFGENPNRDSTTCDNGYGRSYTHSVAIAGNSPQGLCPNGWHIPSTTEWSTITSSTSMSNDFYIKPGNYNLNSDYPLGWINRETDGLYWTSSGASYFVGLWSGAFTQNTAGSSDYFSVRCIADGDLNCDGVPYASETHSCVSNNILKKCGISNYNEQTHFCYEDEIYDKSILQ